MKQQRQIEMVAYALWQQRGCPEGDGLEDWAEAERRVRDSQLPPRPSVQLKDLASTMPPPPPMIIPRVG